MPADKAATKKSRFKSVDDYIRSQPQQTQRILNCLRSAILRSAPAAEETLAYNMPSYRLRGTTLLHFAVWKRHYSLYFASETVAAAFEHELESYDIKRGTISFPLSEPLPTRLIEHIIEFRIGELKGPYHETGQGES